jgi:hypothetical protein
MQYFKLLVKILDNFTDGIKKVFQNFCKDSKESKQRHVSK